MVRVVYVTGCLGFIGYHVTKACLDKGWYVRGVDKLTYASNYDLLNELFTYKNFFYEEKDINDIEYLHECDYVINTAAETHVDNSIVDSKEFLHSNINGTHHLLEKIRKLRSRPVFLHFSTDEVYGDAVYDSFKETDPLKPSNPYSATKAAADMLVLAWARTYKVPYVIIRPTNNYGIGQYVEKFIPRTIKYLSLGKNFKLYDGGMPKRTWLHAEDTASAVITIIESDVKNEIYNISGNYEDRNIVVAGKIIKAMGLKESIDNYVDTNESRPGHDVRYAVDDSKIKAIGWSPKKVFDEELPIIVKYYTDNFVW